MTLGRMGNGQWKIPLDFGTDPDKGVDPLVNGKRWGI